MISIHSILTPLWQHEFIQIILQINRHLKIIQSRLRWSHYVRLYRIIQSLSIADHKRVQHHATALTTAGEVIGHFYMAQSLLLQNRIEDAEFHVTKFLNIHPYHADSLYLLVRIKERQQKTLEAFELLENFLAQSKRRKTWQHLSNLVENEIDFQRFYTLFCRYHPDYPDKPLKYDLACHLSNAATRGKQAMFALEHWRTQYTLLHKSPLNTPITLPPTRKYDYNNASYALSELKKILDNHNIPFFLISGTLLGCIREGKLLGHDKDIDIGVWETQTIHSLTKIFYNSGSFDVLPAYSPDILVVRHASGITIDIFIHYRTQNDYWHAGGKSRWHNTPFELIPHHFLSEEYLIPKNYDLYLKENYGDWRTPKIQFDSALDTPNMEIISQDDFLIYLYKKITFALYTGKKPSERYLAVLREHGEHLD